MVDKRVSTLMKMEIKMSKGYHLYGLRDASRIVREVRARMKGDKSDYARGWRAALSEIETIINVSVADIKAKQAASLTANE